MHLCLGVEIEKEGIMNSVNHHKGNENENVSEVVWETQDYSARKFKTRKTPPIAAQRGWAALIYMQAAEISFL